MSLQRLWKDSREWSGLDNAAEQRGIGRAAPGPFFFLFLLFYCAIVCMCVCAHIYMFACAISLAVLRLHAKDSLPRLVLM